MATFYTAADVDRIIAAGKFPIKTDAQKIAFTERLEMIAGVCVEASQTRIDSHLQREIARLVSVADKLNGMLRKGAVRDHLQMAVGRVKYRQLDGALLRNGTPSVGQTRAQIRILFPNSQLAEDGGDRATL